MLYEEYMKKMDEIASSEISPDEKKERRLALKEQAHRELQVGDGVTVCLWSDRHAGTIIKRTPKTIVIQEDKATLSPDFKPEFSIGGFCAHCTNQSEQSYTYEKDERGSIYTARWSEKRKRFVCYDKVVMLGRHKFHDYNF